MRTRRTVVVAIACAVLVGVVVAWIAPSGSQECVDGIDPVTKQMSGGCSDLRGNPQAGVIAFFVTLALAGLLVWRRRRAHDSSSGA